MQEEDHLTQKSKNKKEIPKYENTDLLRVIILAQNSARVGFSS